MKFKPIFEAYFKPVINAGDTISQKNSVSIEKIRREGMVIKLQNILDIINSTEIFCIEDQNSQGYDIVFSELDYNPVEIINEFMYYVISRYLPYTDAESSLLYGNGSISLYPYELSTVYSNHKKFDVEDDSFIKPLFTVHSNKLKSIATFAKMISRPDYINVATSYGINDSRVYPFYLQMNVPYDTGSYNNIEFNNGTLYIKFKYNIYVSSLFYDPDIFNILTIKKNPDRQLDKVEHAYIKNMMDMLNINNDFNTDFEEYLNYTKGRLAGKNAPLKMFLTPDFQHKIQEDLARLENIFSDECEIPIKFTVDIYHSSDMIDAYPEFFKIPICTITSK